MKAINLQPNKRYYILLFICTAYFGIAFIGVEYYKMPNHGWNDLIRSLFQFSVVLFASFGLILLLSINKYVFALIFPILILICSVLAFFRGTANIILNANLIEVSFHNDLKTSVELISVPLFLFAVINICISILLVRYRIKKVKVNHKYLLMFVGLSIVLSTNFFIQTSKAAIQNRIPYVIYKSFDEYLENKKVIQTDRPDNSQGVRCSTDSLTVVFVIGETLRADHLTLNGYKRQTTPLLGKQNLVSFANIYSPYTNTDRSLAYIFSGADTSNPDKAYTERSFINIFKTCGYKTYWIANQEPTKAFVYFRNETDSIISVTAGKSVYNFAPYSWLDEDCIKPFQNILENDVATKKLIMIHTIGSHWWYKTHYSKEFEKFTPTINSRIVTSNTRDEMVNTYDNTVLYTDYFLNQIIQLLRAENALMIYLSDHGEALGEDGKWLHAIESPAIHNPASIVWMSDRFKKENPAFESTLQQNKLKRINTSFLFPSILMAARISAPVADSTKSIFYPQ